MFGTLPYRAARAAGIAAQSLGKPAAAFPGRVATDADLMIAVDRQQTRLALPLNTSDPSMTVVDPSSIVANNLLTIDAEIVKVTGAPTGNVVPVSRGFDGTTPAIHLASAVVSGFVDAYHHNALIAEVEAIEQILGPNLSNIPTSQFLVSTSFAFAAQTPGGSLAPGNNAITLAPVPRGVNGSNTGHYLYISGGTGTPEACLITGGAAVSGAASGQVIINCANAHSGAWTVSSATAGIQEAIYASPGINDSVLVPNGTHTVRGPVTISRDSVSISGLGRTSSRLMFTGAGNGFVFAGTGVLTGNCLTNLFLNGNSTGAWGIVINEQNTLTLRDLYITNFANGIQITGPDTFDVYIENICVSNMATATGVGVWVNGGAGHYFENMQIAGGGGPTQPFAGIRVQNTNGLNISRTDVIESGFGLLMDPGSGQVLQWIWISECSFDTCSGHGIRIDPTGTGFIASVIFTASWTATNDLSGVAINAAAGTTVDTIQFISHRSYNNGDDGYRIFPGPVNLLFSDCQGIGNSRTTSGAGAGMDIFAGVSRFQIIGGFYGQAFTFPNRQNYGIAINGGASDNYTILGAVVTPNLTGGLSDSGTGQNRVIQLGAGTVNILALGAAATLDLGFGDEGVVNVSGTTAITTILRGWKGRRVRLFKTDAGTVAVGGGGNIPLARNLVQNGAIDLVFDGFSWF